MVTGAHDTPGSTLRVVIVDDDPFTRTALSSMVEALTYDVVASAASAAEALYVAKHAKVDVAVLDLDLGEGPTGIDLARGIRRADPQTGIVLLSTYTDPRLIGHNQAALPKGTVYVVKSTVTSREVLDSAIKEAVAAAGSAIHWPAAQPPTVQFTALQLELMRMIAGGDSNAEIARRRVVTERSVEKSIQRLIKDLGIRASPEQNQRVLIAQAYHRLTGAASARRE